MHIENADVMEAQNLAAIEQHVSVINNISQDILKNIQLLKKIQDSSDISLITKYNIRNREFRKLPSRLGIFTIYLNLLNKKKDKIRKLSC